MPNDEQPNAAEPIQNDVDEKEANYIITREELNNDNAAHSQNDRLSDDVTKRNEATAVTGNEETDWPNPVVSPKHQEKSLPNTADRPENDEIFSERNSMIKTMYKILLKGGMIISCPKYRKMILEMKV